MENIAAFQHLSRFFHHYFTMIYIAYYEKIDTLSGHTKENGNVCQITLSKNLPFKYTNGFAQLYAQLLSCIIQ